MKIKTTTALCFSSLLHWSVIHGANPASTDYVNKAVAMLQAQIDKINPKTYTLYQAAQGGIIFYLDPSMQHGLVAATSDLPATYAWGNGSNNLTNNIGAYLTGIYLGAQNTAAIIEGNINGAAAVACSGYTSSPSYSGWYLPAQQELSLLYQEKNALSSAGAPFANFVYWSSTGSGLNSAWQQSFSTGAQGVVTQDSTNHVRCIRSF